MAIRNLMEDIVTAIVNEIISKEDEKLHKNDKASQDIIAYVLNRVPPKYYTSARGILHGKLQSQFTFQQRVDIFFLTYEAIKIIKNRRVPESRSDYKEIEKKLLFLPHIIGEVLEETTLSMIPDVEALLLYNGKPAKMTDVSWENPYSTHKATKGYYHFWPEFIEEEMKGKREVPFQIIFNHPELKEMRINLSLNVAKDFNFNKSHIVPITLLQGEKGVDISYLCE